MNADSTTDPTSETSETLNTAERRVPWDELTVEQQTEYLVRFYRMKIPIRYTLKKEMEQGRRAFGPKFPEKWHTTPIHGFEVSGHKPAIRVSGLDPDAMLLTMFTTSFVQFDQIETVERAPALGASYARVQPQPQMEPASTRSTAPDLTNGDDCYDFDQITCPDCGKRIPLVLTARVADDDDDDDDSDADRDPSNDHPTAIYEICVP